MIDKRIWRINLNLQGFKYIIFVYGEEHKVRDYVHDELIGYAKSYSGATEEEISAAKILGLPVYMA